MSKVDQEVQALNDELVQSAVQVQRRAYPAPAASRTPTVAALLAILDTADGQAETPTEQKRPVPQT